MSEILITMPDGSEWIISFQRFNLIRAAHYAELDTGGDTSGPEYEKILAQEIEHGNKCPDDVLDFLMNNTHWWEIKDDIKQIKPPTPVDYAKSFVNAEVEAR